MTNPISRFFQERRARAAELERLKKFLDDASRFQVVELREFRAEMERTMPKNPAQGNAFRDMR